MLERHRDLQARDRASADVVMDKIFEIDNGQQSRGQSLNGQHLTLRTTTLGPLTAVMLGAHLSESNRRPVRCENRRQQLLSPLPATTPSPPPQFTWNPHQSSSFGTTSGTTNPSRVFRRRESVPCVLAHSKRVRLIVAWV